MTKQEYISILSLSRKPCQEGLDAFFEHQGSIQDYFFNHERGENALWFCLKNGGNIPEIFTEEVCLQAVKQNGYAIKYLTDEQRTTEVCLAAVKQNGCAIQYLINTQRTPEVCLAAVEQEGYAIQYLTDKQRTPEVCLAAVNQYSDSIEYLTDEQREYITKRII